ncbi:MAG TPA: hypothetical protein VK934_03810 [Fimbriimonas sp.]|nr:hypothetical protein [Fimbriimonas sp.]
MSTSFVPCDGLETSDEAEAISALCHDAQSFLLAHTWCGALKSARFDYGFSKIAVFYFEIEPLMGADPNVWVVVGDGPPAYFSQVTMPTGKDALEGYVYELKRWVEAIQREQVDGSLMPLFERGSFRKIEPSAQIADLLERRIRLISRLLEQG